ncbi:LysR family transcriptional regulator [Caballeronia sp. LZ029]|uniref:LysR family transcriptional regulator n=1 Tax=Caballeronia sp. LZ029 TaxID=3038564 RepID=UPI00285D8BE9|nr:LysR family transcriptional regulator [Caballeronia sp. LZ029]
MPKDLWRLNAEKSLAPLRRKRFGSLTAKVHTLQREGHYGRAAKSCNVSQPTLSAGIRQLEKDLDVHVVRHGKRYDGLTEEGMHVVSWAQQMEDDCKGLRRDLAALRKGIEGTFRLGVLPATSAMAPVLSVALAEKMPLLDQSIIIGNASAICKAVRENELDMALVYLEKLNNEDLDTHLLYQERLFLFQTHSDKQPRNVTWEHVVSLPLCLLRSGVPEVAQSQLAQCAQTIYTDSLDVLAAHVATGRYATVLPQSLAGRLRLIPDLQALAITGLDARANVGFIAARNGLDSKPLQALREMVHTPDLTTPFQAILAVHRNFRPKAEPSGQPPREA